MNASRKFAAHYLFSLAVLSVYGGKVCPFVDSLNIYHWIALLVFIFATMAVARGALAGRLVDAHPPEARSTRQFFFDFGLFVAGGLAETGYNIAVHDFPFSSGLKIVIGFGALGFFTALDTSLEAERLVSLAFQKEGRSIVPDVKKFPLTFKFSLVAVVTLLFLFAVNSLVIIRDLAWLGKVAPDELARAKMQIAVEQFFIAVVSLIELMNLILAYSKNLRMFFGNQNTALEAVSRGKLETRVVVSTNDEFGVMGAYSNEMIIKLQERTQDLLRTQDVAILSMTTLAEVRDNETGRHILRTQRYVKELALCLQKTAEYGSALDDETINLLFKSAPLHDIGKVGIPDVILHKPGKHTDEEFAIMKKHAEYGRNALKETEKLLGTNSFLRYASEIAGSHHEKWDGTGYPENLKGTDIPLSARLMAVADVYDALISKRVYKPAMSHETARKIIVEGKGKHFDPVIVEIFLQVEERFMEIGGQFRDE